MHLGPPVLDKVERSWSCWRHPNASGVGLKVAFAMGNTRFSQAPWDFLEGGCGRVLIIAALREHHVWIRDLRGQFDYGACCAAHFSQGTPWFN